MIDHFINHLNQFEDYSNFILINYFKQWYSWNILIHNMYQNFRHTLLYLINDIRYIILSFKTKTK